MIEHPEMTWAEILNISYERHRSHYWINGFEWYLAELYRDNDKDPEFPFGIINNIRNKFGPLEDLAKEALRGGDDKGD